MCNEGPEYYMQQTDCSFKKSFSDHNKEKEKSPDFVANLIYYDHRLSGQLKSIKTMPE